MSFSETIFLFLLALVVFGPKKLPEIARQVGRYLNEFKRASNEFKAQIEQEIAHLEDDTTHKIPPPGKAPEGAMSRGGITPLSETSANASESTATLANPVPEGLAEPASPPADSEPLATEAAAGTDSVGATTSQEPHA